MWTIWENFCSYECFQTADSRSVSHGFVSKYVPIDSEPKFVVGGAAVELGSSSQGAESKSCGMALGEQISRALLKGCLCVHNEVASSNRPAKTAIAH